MTDKYDRAIADNLKGIATSIPRLEKVMRVQLEVARDGNKVAQQIAANTECLPKLAALLEQLLDVLVAKRTNGHTDLEHASTEDAEGTTT